MEVPYNIVPRGRFARGFEDYKIGEEYAETLLKKRIKRNGRVARSEQGVTRLSVLINCILPPFCIEGFIEKLSTYPIVERVDGFINKHNSSIRKRSYPEFLKKLTSKCPTLLNGDYFEEKLIDFMRREFLVRGIKNGVYFDEWMMLFKHVETQRKTERRGQAKVIFCEANEAFANLMIQEKDYLALCCPEIEGVDFARMGESLKQEYYPFMLSLRYYQRLLLNRALENRLGARDAASLIEAYLNKKSTL
jgi:hypothetical protein